MVVGKIRRLVNIVRMLRRRWLGYVGLLSKRPCRCREAKVPTTKSSCLRGWGSDRLSDKPHANGRDARWL
jgi:hypothetical protein